MDIILAAFLIASLPAQPGSVPGGNGELMVGEPTVIESRSPSTAYVTVFQDDGTTGYFYALDLSREESPIVDALHIYDAAAVSDAHLPNEVAIVWSEDGSKSLLLINDYPHAAFDFDAERGYCRTGFPPPAQWSKEGHGWDDAVLEHFDL